MSATPGTVSRRRTGLIAALAVLLAAAAAGIYLGVGASPGGTAPRPGAQPRPAASIGRARVAQPEVTQPEVTQAEVTGYVHMSEAYPSSGPVSVLLRGAAAASLYRTVEGLRAGNSVQCAEEAHLYQITFTSAAGGQVDVAGYQCGDWVDITTAGKASQWTDANCALADAVRRILPASAVATRGAIGVCTHY
jgi:hypothetical protein